MTIDNFKKPDEGFAKANTLFETGEFNAADQVCDLALSSGSGLELSPILHLKGKIAQQNNRRSEALDYFIDALRYDKSNQKYREALVQFLLETGKLVKNLNQTDTAKELFRMALQFDNDCLEAQEALVNIEMHGEEYFELLSRFHKFLKPNSYLEVGVSFGQSLAQALPTTLAIGIDPRQAINHKIVAQTKMFIMTSDKFFEQQNLSQILNGQALEMAFIDGLHTFQQVLRDFLNIERFSSPETVILIHDCMPVDPVTASADRKSGFWTGDVWKILPALNKYRHDLKIFVTPAPPTGLAIITNLDNKRTEQLEESYGKMVNDFSSISFEQFEIIKEKHLKIIPNDWNKIKDQLLSQSNILTSKYG